jgi:hypothetical protein
MRLSKEARFNRLYDEFYRVVDRYLDRPLQLATDYVLARAYKLSCFILDLENIMGN